MTARTPRLTGSGNTGKAIVNLAASGGQDVVLGSSRSPGPCSR
jgi:predicted dinucleotide-binding enzyme